MADAAGTLVVRLGYRGTDFAGFAEQPGQRTVAGEMRQALEIFLRRPVSFDCAGRTDAGVHALAQYISLPVMSEELSLAPHRLFASLVALTPDDISIKALYRADAGFSARGDACARRYRYRICCGLTRPVMSWGHAWWLRSAPILDLDAMNEAAEALIGEHNFQSFCKASSAALILEDGRSTSRFLSSISVFHEQEAGEDLIMCDVCGNAFLHNMVRVIVGSLVEVGCGRRKIQWLGEALAACDRRQAGPTAPACGLTLEDVKYPVGVLRPW